MNLDDNSDVYGLITQLSRHILQTYRQPFHKNQRFTYDHDNKMIKCLRSRAFEILLQNVDYEDLEQVDPILEIQKHVFVMKLRLRRLCEASTLRRLLEELEEHTCLRAPVHSVLQLLVQLKTFNIVHEPFTNIFYYGKANPAVPEIMYASNNISSFQIYPMECFMLSDKFEITLEPERLQIMRIIPTTVMNELHFLHGTIKSKGTIDTGISDASDFISTHTFDMEIVPYGGEKEFKYIFSGGKGLVVNNSCFSFSRSEAVTTENESLSNTRKSSDRNLVDELEYAIDYWDHNWKHTDITDTSLFNRRTWERFGDIQCEKELTFITDLSTASIHLAKIKQMNSLSLLSEKLINSVVLEEEIPIRNFVDDVKSMLLGIESNTFYYAHRTGFILRENVNVYGVSSELLGKACQEAINWGNCFRFLSHFITPKLQSGKSLQEGLIFKAVCANIKELLLHYQVALVRIFNDETNSGRLLRMFQRVRPVASLITKVAKLCEPYKESQYTLREGNSIIARIYNEAVQVTNTKAALVIYSLLKACCDVYFRFLQKWMFEGVCDDIYGEFMIKTRPQYLRNRDHKFWTKSFSLRNEAIPGFLNVLTESILQCGKTVRLLRICSAKNPVCRVCLTEQPEVKVCLSITALYEQSLRYRNYEEKGKCALGPILSLSTVIQSKKQLEKEMAEFVARAQRDTLTRIKGEREAALKRMAQMKRDFLTNLKEQCLVIETQKKNKNRKQKKENVNESYDTEILFGLGTQENSQRIERTNILNYYENLALDIDRRYIRSQWRAKRMAFYDKRVDLLTSTKHNSQNQSRIIKNTEDNKEEEEIEENKEYEEEKAESISISSPLTELSIPFEDENKNYSRTSCQTIVRTTFVDITMNNNNGENNICDILNNRSRKVEESKNNNHTTGPIAIVTTDTNRLYTDSNTTVPYNIASTLVTVERPNILNVVKINNAPDGSFVNKDSAWSLEGNMTPNNNEIDIQKFRIPSNSSDSSRNVVEDGTDTPNERNDLETPMSCTTDNFPSSAQSPTSETDRSDRSPIEISTTDMLSSNSRTFTKSPTIMKKDATFSDVFALQQDEPTTTTTTTTTNGALSKTIPLTVADIELIDHTSLQAYLEKSIRIPLEVQSRLVNNAVIKYFVEENNLLLHLHSLRSYFFLLNGEFAKSLTDSLYTRLYEISLPVELFNSATLTNLLERALVNSFNSVYVNSELLSLSAINAPMQLHMSDPAALDCLLLNYKIAWPLNIILDEAVMQQYGKIFKFLITSGRVSWVLQEDFNIMKRERKTFASPQYHKLQLYRHSMTQFMNALHNYLTCSVLYASWTEFEKDLENSLTLDQIYLSHVNYIKRILSRCMLNARGEKVRVCLNNIFKVILKFHNRLRSQTWIMKSTVYVHPNFKRLEQLYQAFCELRAYMAHVAFKLATSGYQPHLTHFLNALNLNHLYDLTVKSCRGSSAEPSEL
ncbi:gamma-tubulin complex component 6 isoform X2 [Megalopta genalis]|uniref:gamma-tubulin complex component 6 isoform X2 n=1 Tax=Megalopta genalis TaxID=115081 RepID=UPI003FCF5D84